MKNVVKRTTLIADFVYREEPVPVIDDGEFLLGTLYLGLLPEVLRGLLRADGKLTGAGRGWNACRTGECHARNGLEGA